ncbi:DgyrCDS8513 [Dimorphilus gyrociliatus]|uniref:E3 ubiquitin-protein ligase n=1 Tax=Dimorphilus gyrociliatus TaxID=2664684 RepID=A0A7I8VZI7_9ANNE|nr:DgyrCDS8513 [Dimorphilus gyrociliatus]
MAYKLREAPDLLQNGNKKNITAEFKNKLKQENGKEFVEYVLSVLFEYPLCIPEGEVIDWCDILIADGNSFEEFSKIVKKFDDSPTCGLVWTSNFVAYRCRTCGISPCMSLCADCFNAADHSGHDYNMFRSQAGGACDCGDGTVMHKKGFCPRHGPGRPSRCQQIPSDLLLLPRVVLPKLLQSIIIRIRQISATAGDEYESLDEFSNRLIEIVQKLLDTGTVLRSLISQIFIDQELYKNINRGDLTSENQQHAAKAYQNYLQEKKSLSSLKIPMEFANVANLEDNLNHICILDELMFWMVKYDFPQNIVTLILSILPDKEYKNAFLRAFIMHYSRTAAILEQPRQKKHIANRVVHISVQILSPEELAMKLVRDWSLLHRMTGALNSMLVKTYEPISEDITELKVINCDKPVMKEHCFWPIISDFINVLSHRPAALTFMTDNVLISFWMAFVSKIQAVNINTRETKTHVEIEQDTYYSAYNAELEIAASPMWCLAVQCDQKSLGAAKNVLHHSLVNLLKWLDALKIKPNTKLNPLKVTFHLPLHRYVAVFFHTLTKIQAEKTNLVQFLAENGLKIDIIELLIIHPLNVQISCAEIATDMWNLNGLQIKGQAMTYKQTHFCNSMADPDLYLLQLASCCLQPDHIITMILERFHVLELLSMGESTSNFLKKEHYQPIIEAALTLLATILSNRTMVGLKEEEIIKNEVVALLSMNNRTFSQLAELIPEKCGVSTMETPKIKKPLSEVATFIPPNLSPYGLGGLHQGNYVPSSATWLNLFDPIFTCHRSLARRDYQNSLNRFTKFVKTENLYSSVCSPWPPYRMPSVLCSLYSNLTNLLHCRTMHALLFVLLKQGLEGCLLDGCLSLVIHLIYMALKIKPVRLESASQSSVPLDGASQYPHDKVLCEFMPTDNIIQNALHIVTHVQVAKYFPDNEQFDGSLENENPSETINAESSSVNKPFEKETISSASNNFKRTTTVLDVNESILSLLTKLFRKLAPNKTFNVNDYNDNTPPVGDGAFFIGRVLKEFVENSELCRKFVHDFFSTNERQSYSIEEKRKKAQERQRKIMAKMQKQQQQVQSKFVINEPVENMDEDFDGDNNEDQRELHCTICNTKGIPTNLDPICLVAVVSSSSVLGHRVPVPGSRRVLPLDNTISTRPPETCKEFWNKRIEKLKLLCDEKLLGEAVTLGWSNGIRVKTCGHYLHSSCAARYRQSLSRRDQQIKISDFVCPLCRRTANCILPVLQPSKSYCSDEDSDFERSASINVTKLESQPNQNSLLFKNDPQNPQNYSSRKFPHSTFTSFSSCNSYQLAVEPISYSAEKEYQNEMKNTVTDCLQSKSVKNLKIPDSHLSRAFKMIYAQLVKFMDSSYKNDSLLIITSILRHNVVADLEERSNSLKNFSKESRNSCLLQLLDVLGTVFKECVPHGYTDQLWAMLTGGEPLSNSREVQSYRQIVPLLIRDPFSVFFTILLSLQTPITRSVYHELVKAVLTLNLVQSMTSILIQMTPDERQTWNDKTFGILFKTFQESCVFKSTEEKSQIGLSSCIWTPGSVSSAVDSGCVEFLRTAAYLKFIIFSDPLSIENKVQEMKILLTYLDLKGETVQESINNLNDQLVISWCHQIKGISKMPPKDIIFMLKAPPIFSSPKLIELPEKYEHFFSYHHKAKCPNCQIPPKEPAVCLSCGRIVCFKASCCREDGVYEAIKHTKECGAGTNLFLLVNSSAILVLKINKVASWGSVYLDEHGEEDKNLKRGKPLFLSSERYNLLEKQWATNALENACLEWYYMMEERKAEEAAVYQIDEHFQRLDFPKIIHYISNDILLSDEKHHLVTFHEREGKSARFIFEFLETLKRRENWYLAFIRALRKDKLSDIADEVEERKFNLFHRNVKTTNQSNNFNLEYKSATHKYPNKFKEYYDLHNNDDNLNIVEVDSEAEQRDELKFSRKPIEQDIDIDIARNETNSEKICTTDGTIEISAEKPNYSLSTLDSNEVVFAENYHDQTKVALSFRSYATEMLEPLFQFMWEIVSAVYK